MSQAIERGMGKSLVAPFPDIFVGESDAAKRARAFAQVAAESEEAVLLLGPTGVGKECLANLIRHKAGVEKPFVKADCGQYPESLLQATLFGSVRGAFTGATRNSRGLVREAEGGVLFLDEVGNVPYDLQPAFLRLIEEGVIRPVGGASDVSLSVRFVAATNADLEDRMRKGSFRSDLFYRMCTLSFEIPPLRERREDIPHLVPRLVRPGTTCRFTQGAIDALCGHDWPGNVRDLRNCVRALHAITPQEKNITEQDVWQYLRDHGGEKKKVVQATPRSAHGRALPTYAQVQHGYIREVLVAADGDITMAAAIAQVSKKTLHLKLAQFGLNGFAAKLRADKR